MAKYQIIVEVRSPITLYGGKKETIEAGLMPNKTAAKKAIVGAMRAWRNVGRITLPLKGQEYLIKDFLSVSTPKKHTCWWENYDNTIARFYFGSSRWHGVTVRMDKVEESSDTIRV